jgi:hypothetical protein
VFLDGSVCSPREDPCLPVQSWLISLSNSIRADFGAALLILCARFGGFHDQPPQLSQIRSCAGHWHNIAYNRFFRRYPEARHFQRTGSPRDDEDGTGGLLVMTGHVSGKGGDHRFCGRTWSGRTPSWSGRHVTGFRFELDRKIFGCLELNRVRVVRSSIAPPGVPSQRCQFHLQQNAGHYVPPLRPLPTLSRQELTQSENALAPHIRNRRSFLDWPAAAGS